MDMTFVTGLDQDAQRLVMRGLRPNTRRSYTSAQRFYLAFCSLYQLVPVPADEDQLLRFVAYAHTKKLAPATIGAYLSGVSSLHTLQGLPAPPVASYRLKLAQRAIADMGPDRSKKAPVTYQMLVYLCNYAKTMDMSLLWPAMFSLGFFGALRGSEYSATVQDGTIKAPLVRDLQFTEHNGTMAMVFTIPRSKTAIKPIHVPVGCTGTDCCAVCSILTYLRHRSAQGTLHQAAYLFMDNTGQPVTKQQLNQALKQGISSLGLDHSMYSTHSLRSGAATTAHQVGCTETQIKALGHWASSAYTQYITHSHTQGFALSHKLTQL